ncbi:MAG: DUF4870 domain-containing protein [Oscillatoriales cyanobacterium]|nr:MAG: DUF4870 domain-containing protein [Oscillatoriales cyanobacterium]
MGWHLGQWPFEPRTTPQTTTQTTPQTKTQTTTQALGDRTEHSAWLIVLAHLSVFVGCGVGMLTLAPTAVDRAVVLELGCCLGAIALMVRVDDPTIQANARSAVNFHLNVLLAAALSGATIGLPFLVALTIKALTSPLLAAARAIEDPSYTHIYDFLWQWFEPNANQQSPAARA